MRHPVTPKAEQLLAGVCGFALTANIALIPGSPISPKLTDALSLVLFVWLVWKLLKGRADRDGFVFALALVALPTWIGANHYLHGDAETFPTTLRWAFAAIWGAALAPALLLEPVRFSFIRGIWWGAVVGIGILALEWLGFRTQLETLGLVNLDARDHWYEGRPRVSGLQGHPNGATGHASLLIPCALTLYFSGRWRFQHLVLSFILLLVASQLTATRSAILVALLVIVVIFAQRLIVQRKAAMLATGATFVIIISTLLAVFGPPGGWDRWLDPDNLEENSSGRLTSMIGAAELSLTVPLGLGLSEARRQLRAKTDYNATHNAFLIVGLVFGGIVALIFFLLMVTFFAITFPRSVPKHQFAAVFLLHLFGLFFFEEFLLNPSFIALTFVILVYSAIAVQERSSVNFDDLHSLHAQRRPLEPKNWKI